MGKDVVFDQEEYINGWSNSKNNIALSLCFLKFKLIPKSKYIRPLIWGLLVFIALASYSAFSIYQNSATKFMFSLLANIINLIFIIILTLIILEDVSEKIKIQKSDYQFFLKFLTPNSINHINKYWYHDLSGDFVLYEQIKKSFDKNKNQVREAKIYKDTLTPPQLKPLGEQTIQSKQLKILNSVVTVKKQVKKVLL